MQISPVITQIKNRIPGPKDRGVALLLSLMLVTLITLLVLFVSVISISQVRLAGSSVDSSRAFGAADAGIEYALSRINLNLPLDNTNGRLCGTGWYPSSAPFLSSNAEYCLVVDNQNQPRKITAVGRTKDSNIRRSLEIIVPVFAAVSKIETICLTYGAVTSAVPNTVCINAGYAGSTGFGSTPGTDAPNGTCASNPAAWQGGANTLISSGSYNFVAGDHIFQCYK